MVRTRKIYYKKLSEIAEDIAYEVERLLKKLGFEHARIETPKPNMERSIDILAWRSEGIEKKIHLKITVDADNLSYPEINDLSGFSKTIDSIPIVVSEYDKKIDMNDEVVYEKNNIPVVNVNTLEPLLKESDNLYILSKKGDYYVRIDGSKLRNKREEKGMSLGELADLLRVSRKTIYEYERNKFDVNIEAAEKLIDLFGEDITRPYRIFRDNILDQLTYRQSEVDNKLEETIISFLQKENNHVFHAKKTFVDLLVKQCKESDKKIMIGIEHKRSSTTLEEKIEEMSKITGIKDLKKFVVMGKTGKGIDYYEDIAIVDVDTLLKKLKEIKRTEEEE